jgi:hypothetical protein
LLSFSSIWRTIDPSFSRSLDGRRLSVYEYREAPATDACLRPLLDHWMSCGLAQCEWPPTSLPGACRWHGSGRGRALRIYAHSTRPNAPVRKITELLTHSQNSSLFSTCVWMVSDTLGLIF